MEKEQGVLETGERRVWRMTFAAPGLTSMPLVHRSPLGIVIRVIGGREPPTSVQVPR